MRRCLELARLGAGKVSPNPMVGAVIILNGEIIGEGWHKKYGEAHAEVNAVESVRDKSLLSEATIYVSLEPCAHYGKTPPCAELLARHRFRRCVIANIDPNPKVSGKGIAMLKAAGIEVETGVMAEQAAFLNRAFFTRQLKSRPYVIVKYAASSDGFIAPKQKDAYWLSNEPMRVWSHRLRSENDAIMVGYRTAAADNPSLNIRSYYGENPVRVVIDRNLDLDKSLHLFDRSQRTMVFNHIKDQSDEMLEMVKLNPQGNEIEQVMNKLYALGVGSLVVEGGRGLINKFLECGLWDEVQRIETDKTLFEGLEEPKAEGVMLFCQAFGSNRLELILNPKNAIFEM